jgi:APA family basic amino acid/polyamine antiporter
MTAPESATATVDAKLDRANAEPAELARGLDLKDCVLLVVGSMVGSGIFLTTGQIAGSLPAPWLILAAWLFGGAMALTGALTYAELGAAFPRAGGHYIYLREAYGPLVGYLDGWLSFVASFPGSISFVALGLVAYLPAQWAGHTLWSVDVLWLRWSPTSAHLIAIGCILALSVLNALGLRAGSGAQNLLTGLKVAALAGIAGIGLVVGRGQWQGLATGPALGTDGVGIAGIGAALIGISFAYLGWDASTYMAAEVRHPQRNLPRSLVLGTLLVVCLYLIFNTALLYGLPMGELARSHNPTGDMMARLVGPHSAGLLTVAIVVAILGSLNATIMVGPRIYYAMARDGIFPRVLGSVSRRTKVPVIGLSAQAAFACVIVLSATLGRILAFTVLVIWLLSAVTGAAVFVLRRRRPGVERPYRVWGYPWVPGFFCASSFALVIEHLVHSPTDLLWLAGFLCAGLPVYACLRRSRAAVPGAGVLGDSEQA